MFMLYVPDSRTVMVPSLALMKLLWLAFHSTMVSLVLLGKCQFCIFCYRLFLSVIRYPDRFYILPHKSESEKVCSWHVSYFLDC